MPAPIVIAGASPTRPYARICRHQRICMHPRTLSHALSPPSTRCLPPQQEVDKNGIDLVLSSGFLAFAAHCGFLQAVEELQIPVRGIMGTSSGALIGSMYAAGYTPIQIAEEFSRSAPIERVKVSREWYRGILSMKPAVKRLRELLPSNFEDLQREFAVSVVSVHGNRHELIDQGPLPEAIVASAAVPILFSPVRIPGAPNGPYVDGGVACRIGLDIWTREKRLGKPATPAAVHLIARSSRFSGNDDITTGNYGATVICSPKSGMKLWDISGFDEQFEAARERALVGLKGLQSGLPEANIATGKHVAV